jgi:hypothetical protein
MFGQKGRLSSTFKVLQMIIKHYKKSQNAQTFEHQGFFSRDAQYFWAAMSLFNLKISSQAV